MDNLPYLLACNRIPGLGPRRIALCLRFFPRLADLFQTKVSELRRMGLPEPVVQGIQQFDFHQIEPDLLWMQQPNQHILVLGTPQYPPLLAEIYDPPPILYAKGDLTCLQPVALGIVGTRSPSVSGAETAWKFAYELSKYPLTIVSGMAMGIDAQAHRGCLAAQGKTIAVLGTGIDVVYPRYHQTLAQDIAAKGLLISEFSLGSQPHASHFPRRNRILSGLSKAVLVVEAALRSGSLITAKFAMEQNRDVFAIPGSIHYPQARGCHHLLKQGASLVTTAEEVGMEMGLFPPTLTKAIPIIQDLCDNKGLLDFVGFEATTIDCILERSQFSLEDVLCKIAELELQGLIQMVPGGYMRCR